MISTFRRRCAQFLNVLVGLIVIVIGASVVQLFVKPWGWFPRVSFAGFVVLLLLAVVLSVVSDELRYRDDESRRPHNLIR